MTEDAKVMGVASLQSERGQNLNFAIPVQIVNAAVAEIDQKSPTSPLAGSATGGATPSNQAPEVPAEQVANSMGVELTDKPLFLDLHWHGHSFSLSKDAQLIVVDGIQTRGQRRSRQI
jgi:S1-C subfamily serine protease